MSKTQQSKSEHVPDAEIVPSLDTIFLITDVEKRLGAGTEPRADVSHPTLVLSSKMSSIPIFDRKR